jgi:uncharacterized protein YdhG (YjbR/CyaY superfamily)
MEILRSKIPNGFCQKIGSISLTKNNLTDQDIFLVHLTVQKDSPSVCDSLIVETFEPSLMSLYGIAVWKFTLRHTTAYYL